MDCNGRREILTDYSEITKDNLVEVIEDAMQIHDKNLAEIKYLQNYLKGKQPILDREKEVRSEINHKVVENHAAEIVDFKVGYNWGEPIMYVQRANKDTYGESASNDDTAIAALNSMFFEESKASKDQSLGRDLATCGVGYRYIAPKREKSEGLSQFDVINLDPKYSFVIRCNDMYKTVLAGVSYHVDKDKNIIMGVYTKDYIYAVSNKNGTYTITETSDNALGEIPIVEYIYDNERMGAFERVISLLDEVNCLSSDRLNSIDQFVQAILWMNNCEVDEDQMKQLHDKLGLMTKSDSGCQASVQYLTAELDQNGNQVLKDDLYKSILEIAGVPGRENSTGGNTGKAIMLSNGWQLAETQARSTVEIFKNSEREVIKLALICCEKCNVKEVKDLHLSDVDIKFSRNRTDGLIVKTQGLLNQLTAGVHPLVAITNCDLYSDPQQVWEDSKPYMEKWLYEEEDALSDSGRSGGEDNEENFAALPTQQSSVPSTETE